MYALVNVELETCASFTAGGENNFLDYSVILIQICFSSVILEILTSNQQKLWSDFLGFDG